MRYKVYAAAVEDINSGWVWVSERAVSSRSVVKILNVDTKKSVYCEALAIDENFRKWYHSDGRFEITPTEDAVVLNQWYRNKLGEIATQSTYDLSISVRDDCVGHLWACLQHPQIVVRLSTRLGLLGLLLGAIGVWLGLR